ncbi:CAZyme family GH18 [Penicillium roqueforti]|nr:CAZyme family GH18 [Penicillium roqueforti]
MISFTAPSSYWYLQWFDLPELMKWADYLNLMTYDLHGVWDEHDPFGSHIYAHTNITEIDASLSLLWRNDVSPSKVNLGLAFYGRTFELEDPSCFQPGCRFSGAGAKGPKTDTAGILSFGEIQDLIASNKGSIFTTYDNVAGVNYMVYNEGKSWISFDDKTTFQQKIDFANARGLNGLFIWAIDLDDDNFTALKSVTGTDLTPIVRESSTLSYFNIDKCYNSRCGIDCVEGFTALVTLKRFVARRGALPIRRLVPGEEAAGIATKGAMWAKSRLHSVNVETAQISVVQAEQEPSAVKQPAVQRRWKLANQ